MRPRLVLTLLCLAALAPSPASAQATARDSVLATLHRVFDGMRSRDTAGLHALFDSTARLMAVPASPGASTRPQTPSQFVAGIPSTPADQSSDERLFDPEVRINGPVAQVWTYYTFRRGATFSHCGTDAVTLMRSGTTWKIVSFIWTVRRLDCPRKE